MSKRCNSVWLQGELDKLVGDQPYDCICDVPVCTKSLVYMLLKRGAPHAVTPMGGGVTKITNQLDCCPKCKGTGKVAKKS